MVSYLRGILIIPGDYFLQTKKILLIVAGLPVHVLCA
jgi:hypothetical protein